MPADAVLAAEDRLAGLLSKIRDDAGEIVWIFVCRNFSNPPAGRQPRTLRESNDFNFLPSFAPEPVLVPVPVRVRK